ncbi:MAG: efflux RND transporter permease subunit [Fibrobacteres bacterium]|nr:efflux RND transporter permease subunit [Fibrobacterota bacterium]
MSFSKMVVARPVLVSVASAFLLLLGFLAIPNLPVREYPSIDPATVTVSASWRGADAETVEKQLTEPLEQSLNGIDGIRTMSSQSRDERTQITVEFLLGVDLERAANDVRDRVSRAQRSLPSEVDPPTVAKADANSSPILLLALRGPGRSLLELNEIATGLQDRLQTVPGLAEVRVWGERKFAMRLRVDPAKLAAAGLTLQDLKAVLARENVELPAGQIDGKDVSVALKAKTGLATPEEFGAVVLRRDGTGVVRLQDVARVELGAENEKTLLRLGTEPGIALAFVAQPGANQVAIVDQVRKRLPRLESELPQGVVLEEVFDNTRFVRKALLEVGETIAIAFALVVLVIFLFLREWRTTLVPVLTVPVSLVGVFALVWVLGYSINILTLLGVVLAIGIVVDDAIVVLEIIWSRVEAGMNPREAAIKGLDEIFAAVVATTLVLAAVFVPLLFLQGFTGRLFREFGVVVGGSVLISGFVALTLSAMVSSRVLRPHSRHGRFYAATEPFYQWLTDSYSRVLRKSLRFPSAAVAVLALCAGAIYLLLGALPKELAPAEDRSALQINVTAHEGATFPYMDSWMRRMADSLATIPQIKTYLVNSGAGGAGGATNSGFSRVVLSEPTERDATQDSLATSVTRMLAKFGGARASVTQEQAIRVGGRQALPVQLVVQGPDLEALREVLSDLEATARANPAFSVVETDLRFTKPRLEVEVRRDRLSDLGVTPEALGSSLQLAFGLPKLGVFLRQGKQYSVLAELDGASSAASLDRLRVRSSKGELVPVSALVSLRETMVPPQRQRLDREACFTISAGLNKGVSLGQGVKAMESVAKEKLDDRFVTRWTGSARDFQESSSSLGAVFGLAILAVFLLLAAQFESLRSPFVILLTVPLALVGALGALWLAGMTMNLFSQIGLVLLVGLVTKNGILIVEFATQRLESGFEPLEAVVGAATARLRPILMTSVATVLGILPVALALGAGAESRKPLGVAVIGGMTTSLALTLFVVPAVYLLVTRKPKVHDPV